ncbi:hypothetical protein Pmar_PMAR012084 [Perkinsus marinus ATCC 50983]|uniref:Uncharacterized protein n=1 Tax=Perkinsus marinus (strain ATCC 50983 / TXsc) TaxID=423536 RepID=C5KA18_PERM5|nr:hypothetical protein Pmar_PMAR012084 [Perkinsus marinus ATCC 50983]EER18676.1 hypothetical protein Pmar_PMAR012084 [Perkinsus marinus ATCC 50983]|eukprot:XP_002786880.1 hypothetical protein Pmar_PMAR012084 [Perkinsus marinus ATCC 50983]
MRGYLLLSALIGLVAAQLSLNDVDVTTDFALDIPAAQRAKFDTETVANLSEIEKDIINETKSIWSWIRQVIASPMSIGDYACLTMKAKCGKTLLRQTIQIGYCEPLGTDM